MIRQPDLAPDGASEVGAHTMAWKNVGSPDHAPAKRSDVQPGVPRLLPHGHGGAIARTYRRARLGGQGLQLRFGQGLYRAVQDARVTWRRRDGELVPRRGAA